MNSLAEVCFVGREVEENHARCLVIVVISMGREGAKKCGGGFKVIILRGGGGRGQTTKRGVVFMGGVDPPIHHEGYSDNVILLF